MAFIARNRPQKDFDAVIDVVNTNEIDDRNVWNDTKCT